MAKDRISPSQRQMVLSALFEGVGVNATARITGVCKEAITRYLVECAEAMEAHHDKAFRGLTVARVEIDEQWSFVHTHKERMTKEEKASNRKKGDCWLWAALCADSKALLSWKTGKRSIHAARSFSDDLAGRVDGPVQVTSDLLGGYRHTIPAAFGNRVAYATERKEFHNGWSPDADYLKKRVDKVKRVERRAVKGDPNLATATTCHVERLFLTTRQQNKRLGRKTLGYSKKWENHAAMNSVFAFLYNFTRRHESLGMLTPAQKLGVSDKRWTLAEVIAMVDKFTADKENAAFEAAFASSKFAQVERPRRVYASQKPRVPWYLDKDSGGKDCPAHLRKEGVDYSA
jgi:IS1 family transposase